LFSFNVVDAVASVSIVIDPGRNCLDRIDSDVSSVGTVKPSILFPIHSSFDYRLHRSLIFRPRASVFRTKALAERVIDRNMQNMGEPESPDPTRARLALLDDHGLFREGLSHLLAAEPDFEVVGQCSTSADALELLGNTAVDVVLLELSIGTDDCDEFMSAARKAGYLGKFLLVTAGIDPARSAAALRLCASGIFLKCNSFDRLVRAIRLVASGEASVDRRVMQLIADRYPQLEDQRLSSLTKREQTVLRGLLDGLTNKKIGRQAGVSESAIKATLQQLFDKAGVRTRSQLVRAALDGSLSPCGAAQPSQESSPLHSQSAR
jgi:DNA-binding NarL/FixJ family response regulator